MGGWPVNNIRWLKNLDMERASLEKCDNKKNVIVIAVNEHSVKKKETIKQKT